jgi:hypothetical protein
MSNSSQARKIPVIEGWFTMDEEDPHLIGNRCKVCGDYFFPKAFSCRNPHCTGIELEGIFISRRGRLWSYTINHYPPPTPYVPPDPFVPYTIVVVELAKEKLMVMGQLANGYDSEQLKIGMEMELIVEPLFKDNQGNDHLIWKWKPMARQGV